MRHVSRSSGHQHRRDRTRPGVHLSTLPIALDAMGGDHAPAETVAGAIMAAHDGVSVLLVGDRARLTSMLPADVSLPILHAPDVVGMDEAPVHAIRRLPNSSMNVAMRAVASGRCGGMVSFGNSGAVMAAAVFALGRLPGVERPGILAPLPRADGGRLFVVDCGANVDSKPRHLAQFARLGAAYVSARGGAPRVALLANGDEDGKGDARVRAAAPLMVALGGRYVGLMEPHVALAGGCDVVVCDGFVGNILLKTAEGVAAMVAGMLEGAVAESVRARTDYARLGGGMLIGVDGMVTVGHGRSRADAVAMTLRMAWEDVKRDMLGSFRTAMVG
ncbi:MAG: phosphate acyltransferase PlsX [Myxococcota bacterium]